MVKAGEIRLGNWFILNGRPQRLNSDELWGIAERNTEGTIDEQLQTEIEWLEPIPLTPELLEKAGSERVSTGDYDESGNERQGNDYSLKVGDGEIYFSSGKEMYKEGVYVYSGLGDPESYGLKVELKYLHQFQNLIYDLTTQELTITP